MSANKYAAHFRRMRQGTVDLGDGLSVTFVRPPETDFGSLLHDVDDGKATWKVGLKEVQKYVTGWTGFNEAFFLGAGVGSDDAVPFEAELWAEVVADRSDWVGKVGQKILDAVVAHINSKAEDTGNSAPG